MHRLSHTVALAALPAHVLDPTVRLPLRAGVVAALRAMEGQRGIAFSCYTHVVRTPARLATWLDRRIADDPLLIGYHLPHTARLLGAAGYRRDLVGSFAPSGRRELLDVVAGRPVALSLTAAAHGMVAVDEAVALAAAPVEPWVAANLALVNAVASWVIYAREAALPPLLVDRAVDRLAATLADVQVPLAAAMFCRAR